LPLPLSLSLSHTHIHSLSLSLSLSLSHSLTHSLTHTLSNTHTHTHGWTHMHIVSSKKPMFISPGGKISGVICEGGLRVIRHSMQDCHAPLQYLFTHSIVQLAQTNLELHKASPALIWGNSTAHWRERREQKTTSTCGQT